MRYINTEVYKIKSNYRKIKKRTSELSVKNIQEWKMWKSDGFFKRMLDKWQMWGQKNNSTHPLKDRKPPKIQMLARWKFESSYLPLDWYVFNAHGD